MSKQEARVVVELVLPFDGVVFEQLLLLVGLHVRRRKLEEVAEHFVVFAHLVHAGVVAHCNACLVVAEDLVHLNLREARP